TFALIQVKSARETLRVQNSVRQLAAYMEKARVDAVRRHGNSQILFTNPQAYSVTMDFDMRGVPSTRTYVFESGVQLASSDLPDVSFNWRGRTLTSGTSCVTTFSVSDAHGHGLS